MASLDGFLPLMNLGIRENFDLVGQTYPVMGKDLFDVKELAALYDQIVNYTGYRTLPQVRTFGGEIAEASIGRGFDKTFVQVHRGLKDILPDEIIMNDQYGMITRWCTSKGGLMAEIYATNDELLAAGFFAAGFATATPAPDSFDGQPLFSLSHPLSPGATQVQANMPQTTLPLGMAGMQAARANLEQQLKANGLTRYKNEIRKLVVNPNIKEIALQLAHGEWSPETANRAMNTIQGTFDVVSWPYWTTSGAANPNAYNSWFVLAEMNYLQWYIRESVTFESFRIPSVRSTAFASYQSQIMGAANFIGTYGSLSN